MIDREGNGCGVHDEIAVGDWSYETQVGSLCSFSV